MRANSAAIKAMILEFPTCALVRCRSDSMTSGMRGGNANHDRNATKNPTFGVKTKVNIAC